MHKDTPAEKYNDIMSDNLNPGSWVDEHADHLYAYALSRLNDKEIARDLVQETFLAALEKSHTFKGNSTIRTWLIAILKYKVIDVYRKRARIKMGGDITETLNGQIEYFDPDLNNWKKEHWPKPFGIETSDPIHNKELSAVLQKCMKKLPPLWFAVFTMKHMDDAQTEIICTDMNITPSNYWVIIHRAKVNLRSCLQQNWL
ncbi:sigma-70 family RNA polymerase sigma factor [Mucilaginibacter jinjuensis]|uniref:Sigma-70 family RNA polymerase sigma factor n=1 Tax=Mucilaginibacter jinjuensis TaxID=1176721 RepID=A0ABY7TCT3_9SPHI|nr:sigma-70 family RNA polymerase sigma factor [Mucilaginibacter jinjuensis]WCT14266.1 sigma-70 family RNA polymerase sigma factor [Mucilaginibacter jinjuensis]